MARLIGAIASVMVGLALAVGVSFALPEVAGPDASVDFKNTQSVHGADGLVPYGNE